MGTVVADRIQVFRYVKENISPNHPGHTYYGNFDSDYEPFTITLEPLEPGMYLFEAFATDAMATRKLT